MTMNNVSSKLTSQNTDFTQLLAQIPQNTTVAIVAGEVSGDQLGAGLVQQMLNLRPDLKFVGIGGDNMHSLGVTTWYDITDLSYFGVFDVLKALPKISKIISQTKKLVKESQAQLYIGIDNPDFNLRIEAYAKRELGIKTVHYVSPTVWAWRQGRIENIKKATDLVLCLLPFEQEFYAQKEHPAVFVGHRLANQLGYTLTLDAQVYQTLMTNYAQQRFYQLNDGKVWVSQARRLMEANTAEEETYQQILQRQHREYQDILSGMVSTPDFDEEVPAHIFEHPFSKLKQDKDATLNQPELAQAATTIDAATATSKTNDPNNIMLTLQGQSISVNRENLQLGVNGKYFLTLSAEQVAQLQAKTNSQSSNSVVNSTASSSSTNSDNTASNSQRASNTCLNANESSDNHNLNGRVKNNFILNAQRLQEFVNQLPSAQKARAQLQEVGVLYTTHDSYSAERNASSNLDANGKATSKSTTKPIRIAVLPGSRDSEIKLIFTSYLDGVREAIRQQVLPANVELVVPVAKDKLLEPIKQALANYDDLHVTLVSKHAHQVLQTAVFALVSSGTATLDTLLCHTPMVVGYKLSTFNFILAKQLIRTPYVALANVVMGKEMAKELIQDDLNPENLVSQIQTLLDVNYNLAIRQIYFYEHIKLQQDSDVLAAQACLEVLAQAFTPTAEKYSRK
ncbi:glycosyltransferase family protein [Psittacicella hinzii]|uniref:Lipid-A-disaccharide synthase n=1 Tax=Psittacicella hinzii TaxID=2028575 RepID=A0A3A1YLL9_9GAMM|nr:hypothetical protein [Psittacicella hinzii]RIY38451.1 hypothetical protein CKF58_04320 [Psittacicella hinzii]